MKNSKKPISFLLICYEIGERLFYLGLSLVLTFLTTSYYSFEMTYFFLRSFVGPQNFIFTHFSEAFYISLKISLWSSLLFTLPFNFYQWWSLFISMSYKKDSPYSLKAALKTCLVFHSIFYFILLPEIWSLFFSYETINEWYRVALDAKISSFLLLSLNGYYIFFGANLFFFAVIFMLDANYLSKSRRFFYIGFLMVAAFYAPPDPFYQFYLTLSLHLFYEVLLFYCLLFDFHREK